MGWLYPYVMLVCLNVTIKLSNVSKKKKKLNVTKVQSHVMLVLHKVRIIPSNVRKKKKRTIKYDKSTVTYNVGFA